MLPDNASEQHFVYQCLMLFVGAANSDHFLFYYPLRFDIVFLIALFLMQLFQFFDSM